MRALWLPLVTAPFVSACLYDATIDGPEERVSCAKNDDCGPGRRCSGILSSADTCFEDGWVGAADSGVFIDPPAGQDSIFFQCDSGQRFYSYCTADFETACDADLCGTYYICGRPLDGSADRSYCVASRNGTDSLWQCNPDLSCNDPTELCMRMFEFEATTYKINRRVCVPRAFVRIPPPWASHR